MRLESMTLQAIGPFAGQFTVDFAALGASGLFLLEGPTGAGKSTLIDAVVFALYGKVASDDASADRVRSAYVDSDVESFVDLTFETGAGRFRVRRTPAFDRAKKRGTGTVRQQASVRLWRLPAEDPADATEPHGEVVATRLDEVGAEIQRIVGLDRTQFVQTIVLPQGEFARFLRADPEDRRGLLQKIFGTEVYERMQARLVELRRDADRATAATRALVDERVAHLSGAAGLDDDTLEPVRDALALAVVGRRAADAARDGAVVDDVAAALAGPLGDLADAADRSAQAAARAAAAHATAREVLDAARRTVRLVEERTDLHARLRELQDGVGARDASLVRLETARGARAVRPLVRAVDEAAAALDAAAKSVAAVRDMAPADLADLVPDPLPAPTGRVPARAVGRGGSGASGAPEPDATIVRVRAELVDAYEEAVRAAATLEHAVAVEESVQRLRTEALAARGTVEDHDTEIAAHDAWLAPRAAESDQLAHALAAARSAAATEAEHALAARLAQDRATAHERLAELVGRHTTATRDVARCTAAALSAVEREAAARAARIAGLAGELAAGLRTGDPCPVCGGLEHPHPAALDASHVTAEHVAESESRRRAAEDELGDARAALVALQTELDAARAETDGTTVDDARAALTASNAALAAARDAARDAERLARTLEEHTAATEQRRRSRALAAAARDTAAALVDVRTTALAEAEALVAQARAGHPTVAARHTELVERASVAAGLRATLDDWAVAAGDDVRSRAGLVAALAEHGFADLTAARSADLPDTTAAELEEAVRAHDAELARVQHRLDELATDPLLTVLTSPDCAPDDEQVGATPHPGLAVMLDRVRAAAEAAADAERAARERARESDGESGVAAARAQSAQGAARAVLDAVETHVALLGRSGPVLRLAGLASGTGADNGSGLSLATYVLVRRFEDVVAAANARLAGMSDGRYELVRSDQKEDVRSRRQGLAMQVLDHRTEQERDPRSLSGGETFYVSLCLALGMADVVTAEAGGIDLGTLFVDEGFGSLDPHTLDQVLVELDRLRAGGRVVGVVSHVETLKQTIADRIEVRGTGSGPSTLTLRAG